MQVDLKEKKESNKKEKEKTLKERIIILTDFHFLLFEQVPASKNLGKLLNVCELKNFDLSFADNTEYLNDSECFNFNSKSVLQSFEQIELFFIKTHVREFLDLIKKKIKALDFRFIIFHNDLHKHKTNLEADTDYLGGLIRYKEKLDTSNSSNNIHKDLLVLFQKIIELFSSLNNQSYMHYVNKLQVLIGKKTLKKTNVKNAMKKKEKENFNSLNMKLE